MAKIKIQQPKFIDELEEESRIDEYDFDDKIADKVIENQAIRYKDGRGTTLDSCILRNIIFQECTFKNIDFTTCEINGLNAEIPDLEGAVVTTMQALDLAQILRLVIK